MAKSHSYRSRHTEGPGFGDWTDEVTLIDHFLFGNALTLRHSLAAQTAPYSDKFIITGTVEVPREISVLWYTPQSNKSLQWQINRLLKLSITPPPPPPSRQPNTLKVWRASSSRRDLDRKSTLRITSVTDIDMKKKHGNKLFSITTYL